MTVQNAGLRKRQQISKSNQMMFLWVAGASVVVGFSIVLMVFLVQKIWFGEKVISEKLSTVEVLNDNLAVAPELKSNVAKFNANEDLMSTRLKESDSALQSILDALPADANPAALGSSLQNKLLGGVPGISVESLKVEPSEQSSTAPSANSSSTGSNTLKFSFSISTPTTTQDNLRQVLTRIEKSIRPFTISTLTFESQGPKVVMTIAGHAYYEPPRVVQLTDKVVRP